MIEVISASVTRAQAPLVAPPGSTVGTLNGGIVKPLGISKLGRLLGIVIGGKVVPGLAPGTDIAVQAAAASTAAETINRRANLITTNLTITTGLTA
jgi:hypothetical protein